ncbi:50S ribosomal protein L35 [Candidatus Gracilibacteria bacterium]|nr:50S ribosomal protein L35 [Candidatus Gracilibacteria bacterium]
MANIFATNNDGHTQTRPLLYQRLFFAMKLKTSSTAKKRFARTGSKKKLKYMREKAAKNHLLKNKSKRQKNLDNGGAVVSQSNVHAIRQLLPYS